MATKQETIDKLNELAEYQAQLDIMAMEKAKILDTILTPEIKKQIAELDEEFSGKAETVLKKIEDVQADIRGDVLINGETVKGDMYMAVWNKPRVAWDNKILEGLAMVIPDIEKAKTIGQPTVTIRKVTGK